MERKTPLELLEPSTFDDVNIFAKNWGYLSGAFVGGLAACAANWTARRPTFSGLPKSVALIVACTLGGKYLQDYRDAKLSMKDAIMRDYISTHPELFELPPRQKFSEVLNKWYPIR